MNKKPKKKAPLILKPEIDVVRERLKECVITKVAEATGLNQMTILRLRNNPDYSVNVRTLNLIIDYLNDHR